MTSPTISPGRQKIRPVTPAKTGVILPAAGFGSRMQSTTPKQFLFIRKKPVLIHTINAFTACKAISKIVVAAAADQLDNMSSLLAEYLAPEDRNKIRITTGGDTRQQSVKAGFDAMPDEIDIILVHDGARPLVSTDIIEACIDMIIERGAAVTAVPVNDTIKLVTPEKTIGKTIDRSNLYYAQTPQGAKRTLFEHACNVAERDKFIGTDEASLLEHADIPVAVVRGDSRNIKITRPGDLEIAKGLFGEEKDMLRIGHGFDAHRLVEDRKLILGGVVIDYPLGLLGHSDADVVIHALMDAILGALGKGDIGRHFPDCDDTYKGADSLRLLAMVIKQAGDNGYMIANTDLTILCQAPKLAPHLPAMRRNIAVTCDIAPDTVNIKATTTEKMGYTGRGEGIAAHAVVLLKRSIQVLSPA